MTMSGLATLTSVPLNLLDEHFLNLDQEREPWGVHVEVRVGGRLDPGRLADAIRTAALHHPMARARLGPAYPTDLAYRWEIVDALDETPLTVVECCDETDLDDARERLYAVSPPVDVAPPFAVVLAQGPGGDAVLLNLHHAAGDGVGGVRLMRSILRAYAGAADPVPAFDPLAVRDVLALAAARSPEERVTRRRALAQAAVRRMAPITRVARDGGERRAGYGFELMALSRDETTAVFAKRGERATVNDVLLAALAAAIGAWNGGHSRYAGQIALTMPVNLRPAEWREEVVGNFASYVSLSLGPRDHCDLRRAIDVTAARTRRIKQDGLAGLVVELLVGPSMLPVAAKRHLQDLIPLTGNRTVDTASLSNLLVLDGWPALGADAGAVEAVWFSPPGRAPLGAALGAATVGGRLHIAVRYPRTQFDREAARAFAAVYRDVLVA
jgi:NRPS condensation-like uncharacterized protein